jgi:hypothetical protein
MHKPHFSRRFVFIHLISALMLIGAVSPVRPSAPEPEGGPTGLPNGVHLAQANSSPPAAAPLAVEKSRPRPLISGVRIDTGDPAEERLVVSLEGAPAPQIFLIDGDPVRLVCDFLGADMALAVPPSLRSGGRMIRQVRVAAHADPEKKVRIVLELSPGREYEVDEYFRSEESIYELIVRPAGGITPSKDN